MTASTPLSIAYAEWGLPFFGSSEVDYADRSTQTRQLARQLRNAKTNTRVGGLIIANRSWSREIAESAPVVAAIATGDPDVLDAALGLPTAVVLSEDGAPVGQDWCAHPSTPGSAWVRYERWTVEGRTAHGWVHGDRDCRGLLQTG